MNDITKILIIFDEGNICNFVIYTNFVNINNKNKLDKNLIFTSECQLNLNIQFNHILINGTFKCCPKTFYQVINIAGFYPDMNAIIPLFLIPTTGKSGYLYDKKIKMLYQYMKIQVIKRKIFLNILLWISKGHCKNLLKKIFDNVKIMDAISIM